MIDRHHPLPISKQVKAVRISRGSVYYLPRPVSDYNQELMKRIDRFYLDYPFMSSRILRDMLKQEGYPVGRKHVATLMKRMGIEARIASHEPQSRERVTRSIPIYCATCR